MDRREILTGAAMLAASSLGGADAAPPRLTSTWNGVILNVEAGSRPLLVYRKEPLQRPEGVGPLFARGAYIHPLHAPNGAVVTDDFPADHRHQRGVFFAWTKTQIGDLHPDFWNLGSGTGRIRSLGLEQNPQAAEEGRFRVKHVWEAREGEEWKPVLDEVWEIRVHSPGFPDPQAADAYYLLDITSRQTPRVDLELPPHRYGGMAVRGAAEWIPKDSGLVVSTSEGKDRKGADGTPTRWVDMSGPVGGKTAGIALLEHRSVPRSPNRVRMHPDVPYYVFTPIQEERLLLPAGKEHLFRYRLVAHNGPADPALLNRLYAEFAGAGE